MITQKKKMKANKETVMNHLKNLGIAGAVALGLAACGKEDNVTPPPVGGASDVTQNITADTTWTKNNVYTLKSHIFVEAGTLTIEAGTKILGGSGTSLVITKSAKLNAVGTAAEPIIFTSARPDGERAAGDWGGVVMLGSAPINVSGGSENIEGFPSGEALTEYGGTNGAHDCGKLAYARIEFGGFQLAMDNELNGLTLGGCGSATKVDYVQVHKGADDGVEVFGGTVDLKHIVITQSDDDGLDWDFGWVGKVQYLFIQQNAVVGNYAIEADSNKNSNDALPRSAPQIYNATFVGSDANPGMAGKLQQAFLFRRGTAGRIVNSVVAHFADGVVDVTDASSVTQATEGNLSIESSVFYDNANANELTAEAMDNDMGFDEAAIFGAAAKNNRFVDPMLTAMNNLTAPNPMPMVGSPVMTGAASTPAGMESANFIGAFGTTDWMAGWTAFPSN